MQAVSRLHSSAHLYATVVGSVPESRAGTRNIKDDDYVHMFSRCDLTFCRGLCTHLTIAFFSGGLGLDS